jgi:hypothetical protein
MKKKAKSAHSEEKWAETAPAVSRSLVAVVPEAQLYCLPFRGGVGGLRFFLFFLGFHKPMNIFSFWWDWGLNSGINFFFFFFGWYWSLGSCAC